MILSVEENEDFLPAGIFNCSNQRQPRRMGEVRGLGDRAEPGEAPSPSPSPSRPGSVSGGAAPQPRPPAGALLDRGTPAPQKIQQKASAQASAAGPVPLETGFVKKVYSRQHAHGRAVQPPPRSRGRAWKNAAWTAGCPPDVTMNALPCCWLLQRGRGAGATMFSKVTLSAPDIA